MQLNACWADCNKHDDGVRQIMKVFSSLPDAILRRFEHTFSFCEISFKIAASNDEGFRW